VKAYTIVAGSFGIFHKGHKELLRTAASQGDPVIVGVTTDKYVRSRKSYSIASYSERSRAVGNFLSTLGADFEVHPLDEKFGNSTDNPDYRTIVVSPETYSNAMEINRVRTSKGLQPLYIVKVNYVLGEDLFPINSTRIAAGEITRNGRRINPVQIGIATGNELKTESLKNALKGIMKNFQVDVESDYTLSTDQPIGSDTVSLAAQRARVSLGNRDYGVGIESGIFVERISSMSFDFHVCAVIDRYSRITFGFSSGFQVPDNIVELVKEGYSESLAFQKLHGVEYIGKREGIIGILSRDQVNRSDLIIESVRNAFLPRISPEHFSV
jgi:pantetheine-phosphate adenylyltransferase